MYQNYTFQPAGMADISVYFQQFICVLNLYINRRLFYHYTGNMLNLIRYYVKNNAMQIWLYRQVNDQSYIYFTD